MCVWGAAGAYDPRILAVGEGRRLDMGGGGGPHGVEPRVDPAAIVDLQILQELLLRDAEVAPGNRRRPLRRRRRGH